jgi:hypothetical protein
MLQHNAQVSAHGDNPGARHKAHAAHAVMVGLHALCCGLPIAALMLTAASGAAFGTAAFFSLTTSVHQILHAHEIWIVCASILLVSVGGYLEWRARRGGGSHGFPWMFALSVFCLAANLSILVLHRAT